MKATPDYSKAVHPGHAESPETKSLGTVKDRALTVREFVPEGNPDYVCIIATVEPEGFRSSAAISMVCIPRAKTPTD